MSDNDQFIHINRRLDELAQTTKQVLELARQMSVFQVKQEQQTSQLEQLDKSIKGLKEEFIKEIKEIDDKLLDNDKDKKASIDRVHKRVDEIKTYIDNNIEKSDTIHRDLDKHTISVENDVNTKVSFVRGVVYAIGIVVAIAQGVALKFYSDIDTAIKQNSAEVSSINKKLNEHDRLFDNMNNNISNIKDKLK